MTVACVSDPDRMMVAGEHSFEPCRRLANLVPVKARPRIERLVIGGNRRHQPRDFRDVLLARRPHFDCHPATPSILHPLRHLVSRFNYSTPLAPAAPNFRFSHFVADRFSASRRTAPDARGRTAPPAVCARSAAT